jgi:hypothetical protein
MKLERRRIGFIKVKFLFSYFTYIQYSVSQQPNVCIYKLTNDGLEH